MDTNIMSRSLSRLLEIANEIENFPLGHCGPSDDPDMQTAYLYSFRGLAKRFVATAKRIGNPELSDLVEGLDTSPEFITEAYDLRANLFSVIDYLKDFVNISEFEQVGIKKADRYNLIKNIATTLQERMNTTGINVFLGGFDVEHENVDIVPSKRVYVEKLLAKKNDSVVIQIAKELDLPVPIKAIATAKNLDVYLKSGGYQAASHDFERALSYVEADPEQALGSASSTLESICKGILDGLNEPHPNDESLQPLLKTVFNKMDLSPEGHADPDIKRVLGGLLKEVAPVVRTGWRRG